MKMLSLMLSIAVLAGCARTSDADTAQMQGAPTPVPQAEATPAKAITASATGTVESVDVLAKTVAIAHGPIAAVKWPAMTMTFKAPDADLNALKQGDHVAFEFTSTGMNGTITTITRQ
jgi:Cu(I)/Ag(I) efflux system protein CusF